MKEYGIIREVDMPSSKNEGKPEQIMYKQGHEFNQSFPILKKSAVAIRS
jgi:hypothetical protein